MSARALDRSVAAVQGQASPPAGLGGPTSDKPFVTQQPAGPSVLGRAHRLPDVPEVIPASSLGHEDQRSDQVTSRTAGARAVAPASLVRGHKPGTTEGFVLDAGVQQRDGDGGASEPHYHQELTDSGDVQASRAPPLPMR